jgi:hypothetical protein
MEAELGCFQKMPSMKVLLLRLLEEEEEEVQGGDGMWEVLVYVVVRLKI